VRGRRATHDRAASARDRRYHGNSYCGTAAARYVTSSIVSAAAAAAAARAGGAALHGCPVALIGN